MKWQYTVTAMWGAVAAAVMFFGGGCRSVPPLPPANTAEPGWTIKQGQAVWRQNADAPEIAGELLLATNPQRGASMLQFSKNPLPLVTVQTSNESWQVQFVPKKRRFAGKGQPTSRLIWVHLARALNGEKPRPELKFEFTGPHEWQIENRTSGEKISGFLN